MGKFFSVLTLLAFMLNAIGYAADREYGVYEYVVKKAQGSFDQVTDELRTTAEKAGWTVLATVDAGKMEGCTFSARVLVLYQPAYAKMIMDANKTTGPFALLDRINLFQDEDGLHVSVVNPHSINRTVLLSDIKYFAVTEEHRQALRAMITSVVKGEQTDKQYGEIRDAGYIGKTMGVIAGGSFDTKLEDEFVLAGAVLQDVSAKVEKGLKKKGKEWGTHHVFTLPIPEYETVLFGTTGTPLDTKSFGIVGAGDDDDRDEFKCPGLAHAAAYPIEIVVVKDGNDIKVRMIHAMFRMKMYFEDAGKWAFMKNMGMPGSIADEITGSIKSELGIK